MRCVYYKLYDSFFGMIIRPEALGLVSKCIDIFSSLVVSIRLCYLKLTVKIFFNKIPYNVSSILFTLMRDRQILLFSFLFVLSRALSRTAYIPLYSEYTVSSVCLSASPYVICSYVFYFVFYLCYLVFPSPDLLVMYCLLYTSRCV